MSYRHAILFSTQDCIVRSDRTCCIKVVSFQDCIHPSSIILQNETHLGFMLAIAELLNCPTFTLILSRLVKM